MYSNGENYLTESKDLIQYVRQDVKKVIKSPTFPVNKYFLKKEWFKQSIGIETGIISD